MLCKLVCCVIVAFTFAKGQELTCNYEEGNGIGKHEYRVGKVDRPMTCARKCENMKKKRPDVNGVIYSARFRVCYCIGGMQGRRKNPIWRSCFLLDKDSKSLKVVVSTPAPSKAFSCSYAPGFGYGGSQYFIGSKRDEQDCSSACYEVKKTNPNVNGASFAMRNNGCYCESNMRKREKNLAWKSCFFEDPSKPSPSPTPKNNVTKKKKKKKKNKNKNKNKRRKKNKNRKNRRKNKKKNGNKENKSTLPPTIPPTTQTVEKITQTTTTTTSPATPEQSPTTTTTTTTFKPYTTIASPTSTLSTTTTTTPTSTLASPSTEALDPKVVLRKSTISPSTTTTTTTKTIKTSTPDSTDRTETRSTTSSTLVMKSSESTAGTTTEKPKTPETTLPPVTETDAYDLDSIIRGSKVNIKYLTTPPVTTAENVYDIDSIIGGSQVNFKSTLTPSKYIETEIDFTKISTTITKAPSTTKFISTALGGITTLPTTNGVIKTESVETTAPGERATTKEDAIMPSNRAESSTIETVLSNGASTKEFIITDLKTTPQTTEELIPSDATEEITDQTTSKHSTTEASAIEVTEYNEVNDTSTSDGFSTETITEPVMKTDAGTAISPFSDESTINDRTEISTAISVTTMKAPTAQSTIVIRKITSSTDIIKQDVRNTTVDRTGIINNQTTAESAEGHNPETTISIPRTSVQSSEKPPVGYDNTTKDFIVNSTYPLPVVEWSTPTTNNSLPGENTTSITNISAVESRNVTKAHVEFVNTTKTSNVNSTVQSPVAKWSKTDSNSSSSAEETTSRTNHSVTEANNVTNASVEYVNTTIPSNVNSTSQPPVVEWLTPRTNISDSAPRKVKNASVEYVNTTIHSNVNSTSQPLVVEWLTPRTNISDSASRKVINASVEYVNTTIPSNVNSTSQPPVVEWLTPRTNISDSAPRKVINASVEYVNTTIPSKFNSTVQPPIVIWSAIASNITTTKEEITARTNISEAEPNNVTDTSVEYVNTTKSSHVNSTVQPLAEELSTAKVNISATEPNMITEASVEYVNTTKSSHVNTTVQLELVELSTATSNITLSGEETTSRTNTSNNTTSPSTEESLELINITEASNVNSTAGPAIPSFNISLPKEETTRTDPVTEKFMKYMNSTKIYNGNSTATNSVVELSTTASKKTLPKEETTTKTTNRSITTESPITEPSVRYVNKTSTSVNSNQSLIVKLKTTAVTDFNVTDCVDTRPDKCEYWKKYGSCKAFPTRMKLWCRKTCEFCVVPTKSDAIVNRFRVKELLCDNGIMKITITIDIDSDSNDKLKTNPAGNITLTDPACRFTRTSGNKNEMTLSTKYGQCGAIVDQSSQHITYKNRIFNWDLLKLSGDGKVYRSASSEVGVMNEEMYVQCRVERNYNSSLDGAFKPKHSSVVQITKTQFGKMTLHMSLFKSSKFDNKYITREFPVVIDMKDDIYVELAMDTSNEELLLSPQECYATMTNNPNDEFRYSIFKDRCPRDTTFSVVKKSNHNLQFQIKVFDFLRKNKGIYMHCTSTVCKADSKHPMCQFGCEDLANDRKNRRTMLLDKGSEMNEIYTVSSGYIEVNTPLGSGDESNRADKSGQRSSSADSFTSGTEFIVLLVVLVAVTIVAVASVTTTIILYRKRRGIGNSANELVTYL